MTPLLACGIGVSQCLSSVTVMGACGVRWTRGHGQSQHGDRSPKQDEPKPDIPVRSKYKEQVFPSTHTLSEHGENMGREKTGETELWRIKCPEG